MEELYILFKHMNQEHDLILTDSQLWDIVEVVKKVLADINKDLDSEFTDEFIEWRDRSYQRCTRLHWENRNTGAISTIKELQEKYEKRSELNSLL